jgi:predicted nucleotidyltransferase
MKATKDPYSEITGGKEVIQPKYGKMHSQPQYDYHHMTWETFLTIRECAQEIANKEGYSVYLVGSVLFKAYPRDLDISMVMPVDDFENRYGKLPDDEESLKTYLDRKEYWSSYAKYSLGIELRIRYATRIDFKIQPDVWFENRDKILLAEPNGKVLMIGTATLD